MISARFFLAGEQYTGCEISGHADYSEEGTDVICAYVSATIQTVANLMTEISGSPFRRRNRKNRHWFRYS